MGPWLVLAAGVGAALVAIVVGRLQLGGYLLSSALGATAVMRAILPVRLAGAIVVRSRTTDVLLLAGAATAAAVLAATIKLTV